MNGVIAIPIPGLPLSLANGKQRCPAPPEFFAGPENRLLDTAIRSVLEHPADGYNPLVLYGPSDTGKSHLARGLAAQWKDRYRRRRVEYVTGADFARQLAEAMQTQAIDELRRRYRRAALLVFEDVDRLAGKDQAQEELLHTLDALMATGKQAVVTAAGAPPELPGIMPGLQSRLVCGLGLRLAPPGPAARQAILQQLARTRELNLSDQAACLLAEGLPTTASQLLAALVELEVQARLHNGTIDDELARDFLLRGNQPRPVALREVVAATARLFSLKPQELRGRSRRQAIATARAVAMYLARQLTGKSLQQIGGYFGGRDHTTVMYACRKTEELIKKDASAREAVERLHQNWREA